MDNKFKTKRYDLYWLEKQKHDLAELKRVVAEAGLEDQLKSFPKTQMDYHEDAINWFEVRDIKVDSSADIKKTIEKTIKTIDKVISIKKKMALVDQSLDIISQGSNKKPKQEISIGLDFEG